MLDLRAHFSRFLGADPGRLHFAAHSHHPWPDVTREAQLRAWDEAARLMDGKWARILGPLWREAQGHVARHLRLPDPATVVFAPSTHDFVVRILSALPLSLRGAARPPRVLTTDGEFHSFGRQAARLEEEGLIAVTRIPSEPGPDCLPRLVEAAQRERFDLIWVSEVFFGTGFALTGLEALAAAAGEAVLVLDGYHAFLARPVDLAAIADRAFWLAGGYKYAMAGEGTCFLHCPPGWLPRPRATGWFAGFAALSEGRGGDAVPYPVDAGRFLGATFDPSGLYRFNAAMGWLQGLGLDAAAVHAHALALQFRFVVGLEAVGGPLGLDPARLAVALSETRRGNFLAFDLPDAAAAEARLAAAGIVTDHRGARLRIGFGLHHTAEEVDRLLNRLRRIR